MNIDLTGQTALVTGGTRGIGRAIVEELARAGARVAFTFRSSRDEADALRAALAEEDAETVGIQSDAADPSGAEGTVRRVMEDWGRLDILVNNAGITRDALMIRMSEEDWDAVLDTNLKSVFSYSKEAYRVMMRQRSGRIVNISSISGVMGNAGQTNYAASKAGMIGFSKSLARELAGRGVTVNVVAPGYVETDMTDRMPEAAKEAMLSSVPLGRTARPEEIAAAVHFLASPAAAYITGHVLLVDGGLAM